MFGGGSGTALAKAEASGGADPRSDSSSASSSPEAGGGAATATPSAAPIVTAAKPTTDQAASGEKRTGNGSPQGRGNDIGGNGDKKRRSSGVGSKATSLLASAKNSLSSLGQSTGRGLAGSMGGGGGILAGGADSNSSQTPLQKLGKQDPALAVPQGQHNNSAGESLPGPRSTFRVGVWEDRNKKCRRTMEDTHAFLYNFLHTPAPQLAAPSSDAGSKSNQKSAADEGDSTSTLSSQDMVETDNGYFAIFDGHAGTFAADWCGKKLHLILEENIRKNPNLPIPELLDQSFTGADAQLEKLPVKNSGCTAAVAVLRWEDRVPVPNWTSATGSQAIGTAAAAAAAAKAGEEAASTKAEDGASAKAETPSTTPAAGGNESEASAHARLKPQAQRQRVLYTANVGDARIILCRQGKALRLSYDHKGSDEYEGKRIANAGGLILNNRVNGVLAVTRALGDTYMKDLVTGHPYTTETVIQPDLDEFIILACDGLWDVCSDQEAVDLVRHIQEPISAAQLLVDHALSRFSTDNLSCMIVRFDRTAVLDTQNNRENPIGVEGDSTAAGATASEADKIVGSAKQKIADGTLAPVGVSASNSGRGRDPAEEKPAATAPAAAATSAKEDEEDDEEEESDEEEADDDEKPAAAATLNSKPAAFKPTALQGPVVEEDASSMDEADDGASGVASVGTGTTATTLSSDAGKP